MPSSHRSQFITLTTCLIVLSATFFASISHGREAKKSDKKSARITPPTEIDDAMWTPVPVTTPDAEPWQKERDPDWVDDRTQSMEYGSLVSHCIEFPKKPSVPRGLAITLDDGGATSLVFDSQNLGVRAAWSGGFLNMGTTRFGLTQNPTISGDLQFHLPQPQLWYFQNEGTLGDPLTREQLKYIGLHRNGQDVTFEYSINGTRFLDHPIRDVQSSVKDGVNYVREIEFGPIQKSICVAIMPFAAELPANVGPDEVLAPAKTLHAENGSQHCRVTLIDPSSKNSDVGLLVRDQVLYLMIGATQAKTTRLHLQTSFAPKSQQVQTTFPTEYESKSLEDLTQPGKPVWGEPLITKGELGAPQGPFAIDTLTLPYDNPFRALFFTSGVDFTKDGTAYLCTVHGDVWQITGIDDTLNELKWHRFATGLWQPLGLRVVDEETYVLGRDQITRLHDHNNDGEADFYECFNNDWFMNGQRHAFAMSLETDPAGNFYFMKSGINQTPHGGTVLKVSRDGSELDVIATGYRHPNGLGVGPKGQITTADNEGNWVPKTRIDWIKPGGFYGFMPQHMREAEPEIYDPPLCWIPKDFDNSAGGQVWIDNPKWGPLDGQMLHLSYGQCIPLLVLYEEVDGVKQGGTVKLPVDRFLSGIMRGRFSPHDGHLYLTGLDGWQTAAVRDGCLQRVRYVGRELLIPTELHVFEDAVELTYPVKLDRESVENADFQLEIWGYRWTEKYGSDDYLVSDPKKQGHDSVTIRKVELLDDEQTIRITPSTLRPVMQMSISGRFRAKSGRNIDLLLYNTVHRLAARKN